MYENIEFVIQEIQKNENIVLAGHIAPDGDAISASFALCLAIKKMGKTPILLLEKYSDTYSYLSGHQFVYKGDYESLLPDLFISLDCGGIDRLGEAGKVFEKAKKTINIDHHISNNSFADLNIVNFKASSTSEIVFEIINKMEDIDFEIATCIYTGMIFDTAAFKHNAKKRTHQIAGELVQIGVDTDMVHTNLLYTHTLENAKLLSKAIQNISIDNGVCCSTLTKEEIIEDCKAKYNDLEGISGYLVDFKGVNISVFLYEKKDGSIKLSLRSKKADVNKIAAKFNGGGHILASGATLNVSLEEAKKAVLEEIKNCYTNN